MAKPEQTDQVPLHECNRQAIEADKARQAQMDAATRAAHRAVDIAFRNPNRPTGRVQKNLRAPESPANG